MKTFELHFQTSRFDHVYSGHQSALYADMTTPATVGQHVLVQEFDGNHYCGRWIRLQVTHVEQTTNHSQVLSVRPIARSTAAVMRKRAA